MVFQLQINSALQDIIKKYSIDGQIGVACSGGIDSTVLAHALASIYDHKQITLLYINHHLRDDASDEEKFVVHWAEKQEMKIEKFDLNFEFVSNIEEIARNRRYEIFDKWASENKAFVFTGHHKNDQIETILYRVFTGTGINGLNGIKEKKGQILRPFLEIERTQINGYAKENELEYYTDKSNFDDRFKRNIIRHKIVPVIIDNFGPAAEENILKFKDHFNAYFRERDTVFSYLLKNNLIKYSFKQIIVDKSLFFIYFHSFTKFLIEKAINQVFKKQLIFSEKKWSEILGKISGHREKIQLPHLLELDISEDFIWVQDASKREPLEVNVSKISGFVDRWFDWEVTVSFFKSKKDCFFTEYDIFMDADKTGKIIKISSPLPGLKIKKANNEYTSEVRKIYGQKKVPFPMRNRIPVILHSPSNQLIGGPYIGTSELYEISENTKNIIALHFKPTE